MWLGSVCRGLSCGRLGTPERTPGQLHWLCEVAIGWAVWSRLSLVSLFLDVVRDGMTYPVPVMMMPFLPTTDTLRGRLRFLR